MGGAGRVGDGDWVDAESRSPAQSQTSRPSRSRRKPFGHTRSHGSTHRHRQIQGEARGHAHELGPRETVWLL